MFYNLVNNLKNFLPFPDDDLDFFISLMEPQRYKKHEKIIRIGEPVDHVFYIDKGLVRYYSEYEGKDQTLRLFRENMWVSEYASFLTRKPSPICIEALEDTTLFQLHFDQMQAGYERSKIFERFGRKIAEALFIREVEMATERRIKSAETRYLELLQNDPALINRVPLKYIASVLGIEPESLSRIRRRTSQAKNGN